jgi:hypothetical protein
MVRFAINRIAQAIPTPSIPRSPARMLDAEDYPLKPGKRFSLEFTYMAISPF